MPDRYLTGSVFMKQCGDLTARVTVILSWNISGKSGRSWLLVRFTVILIQFGGVVIGGKFGNDIDSGLPDITHILGSPSVVRLARCDVARLDVYA